jgi:hypothetical protein
MVEVDVDRLPELLAGVTLRRIQEATGLSVAASSRIRSDDLKPHRRHWTALITLRGDQQPAAPRPSKR